MEKRQVVTKGDGAAGLPGNAGNASSTDDRSPARPWTAEEMAAAKPLPLPTVEPAARAGVTRDSHGGNASTTDDPRSARPWTAEEMARARPLPMPTVEPVARVGTAGIPYAGRGETKAAGRPEKD
jgi:hypothetical protein